MLEAAKLLGLEKVLNRKPKPLSGGQRQCVARGRWLSGPLGPGSFGAFQSVLSSAARQSGCCWAYSAAAPATCGAVSPAATWIRAERCQVVPMSAAAGGAA